MPFGSGGFNDGLLVRPSPALSLSSALSSWNPAVPYAALQVDITDLLGLLTSSLGGATLEGGWPWPINPDGTDATALKRQLRPAGTVASVAGKAGSQNTSFTLPKSGPTFVQINNVVISNAVGPTTEDCGANYDPVNGGLAFPANPRPTGCETGATWGDTTVDLFPAGKTAVLLNTIHVEIDRDWKASGQAGPSNSDDWIGLLARNSASPPIDVQGFVSWDTFHLNESFHSFSGWELHPLTAWRVH